MNEIPIQAFLRRGRESTIAHGHPWVFAGAVGSWSGTPAPGSAVDVRSQDGTWLGRGLANPDAELVIRIYSRNPDGEMDAGCLLRALDGAIARREALGWLGGDESENNACRVVFSESDGLSGLIVDRYGSYLVMQVSARCLLPFIPALREHLRSRLGITDIQIQFPDADVGREHVTGDQLKHLTRGSAGVKPLLENGYRFELDPAHAQKTGFYLDQRINRKRVAAYAQGRSVLSAYCYTGGFEVNLAGAGAAEIVGIDSSQAALTQAKRHLEINGLETPAATIRGSVPEVLRKFRDERKAFDLIVLDPPRFVAMRKQMNKGLRAYKDINLLALKLLRPGGILATFSCSGLVKPDVFQETLRWAAVDAGREVRILEELGQPSDHPVHLAIPESRYLKGLLVSVE